MTDIQQYNIAYVVFENGRFLGFFSTKQAALRLRDDRPDLGSWDEIEKITGLNPTKQETPA